MKQDYAKAKLTAAIHSMVTDPGEIRTRLWNAFQIFHTLTENDFADENKDDWNFIYANLTKEEPTYGDNGEITTGKVQNTLKTLDENTCIKIAERIVELASILQ